MRLAAVAVALCLETTMVSAAPQATCRDFTAAQGADQALFYGFVYGYVAGKMDGRSDDEINAATVKLARLVADYCARQPDDRVLTAVGKLAGSATGGQ